MKMVGLEIEWPPLTGFDIAIDVAVGKVVVSTNRAHFKIG
jgi:hypothetical protein